MAAKIGKVIIALLMLAIIGLYLFEVFVKDVHFTENLLRTISVVCVCIAALLRGNRRRRNLKFYEKAYARQLENAFREDAASRKKLVAAYRLFDEGKYKQAETAAAKLKEKCISDRDRASVYLLSALVHTDMGLYQAALQEYEELIARGAVSATIYNNLGQIYTKTGDTESALRAYGQALVLDPGHAISSNNIAQLYFRQHDFPQAIAFARQALDADSACYQASTLLAIIYSIEGNREMASHYSHIAVSSGQNPADLKQAIAFYKSAFEEE